MKYGIFSSKFTEDTVSNWRVIKAVLSILNHHFGKLCLGEWGWIPRRSNIIILGVPMKCLTFKFG